MANCVLFAGKEGWDISHMPFCINSLPARLTGRRDLQSSWHNPKRPSQANIVTLHRYITEALLAYLGIPGFAENYGCVAVSDNEWAAEHRDGDKTHLFVYRATFQNGVAAVGKMFSAVASTSGQWSSGNSLGSSSDMWNVSGAILAMLPLLMETYYSDKSLAKVDKNPLLSDIKKQIEIAIAAYPTDWGEHLDDNIKDALYFLNDMIYYGIEDGHIPLRIPNGAMEPLQRTKVKNGIFNGTVICGQPILLCGGDAASTTAVNKALTVKEAKLRYAAWINAHSWTQEEELLIPTFEDDFKVQPEVIEMADKIVGTSEMRVPFRNFLWRGITGYGKSTGTKVLACILHTPRLELTCHTDMLAKDLISEFIPCNPVDAARGQLPTLEEITLEPESAWESMTGEDGTDKTSEECFEKYSELLVLRAGCTSPVKVVESAFVKAVSHGYICEIQEVSRIKDSGVMVALNQYDLPNAMIPLVDGGYTYRKKDAVVVFTDNVGYASCRPIDQSVLRRCRMIFDANSMEKKPMLERIKYNTGWTKEAKTLNALYDLYEAIREYCADKEITEGSCTICELESLVCCVQSDDRYLANLPKYIDSCIISKCTNDFNEQNEIRSAVQVLIDKVT